MRAILLSGIVAATAGAAPLPLYRSAGTQAPAAAPVQTDAERPGQRVPADTAHVQLAIQGMTCGSCAVTARLVLERVDGVYRADVSHDSASAVVWYDSTRTSPERFIAKLREMTGYEARVVEEPARKDEAREGG